MNNLRKRVVTAVILGGLFLLLLSGATLSPTIHEVFSLFGFAWCLIATYELVRFSTNRFELREQALIHLTAFLLPSVIVILSLPLDASIERAGGMIVFGNLLSLLLVLGHAFFRSRTTLDETGSILASGLLGLIHTGVGAASLIALTRIQHFEYFLTWCVLGVVVSDTTAYFCGKRFGKMKLNPILSPGKTVVGSVGGFACGGAVSFLTYFLLPLSIAPGEALIGIILFQFAVQLGDLCVSFLKRIHNVKHSGTILPGHGGMLDRVDGLLLACSVFMLLLSSYSLSRSFL